MKKILVLLLLMPISIKASTIVMETDSNRILYSDDIHNVRSVASISKIMTCIIAIENGNLDEKIIVENLDGVYGSAIYIKEDEILTLKDLLYGLMLRSGNDAALVIANTISKNTSEFVSLMNQKAKSLGMKNTVFNNPSGLDSIKGNYSTAYDMAILSSYAIKNNTYREIVKTKKYKLKTNMNNYIWENKNRLLNSYKYIIGGKTGYTTIAKRTLVTNALKDNLSLTIVTLNNSNDFENHRSLYEEYFNNYKNYQILEKGQLDILNETYYKKHIIYIKNNFSYPLTKEEKNNIILKFEIEKQTNYKDEDIVGKVKVMLYDRNIYEDNLYLKLNKEKITIWKLLKRLFND